MRYVPTVCVCVCVCVMEMSRGICITRESFISDLSEVC